MQYIHINIYIYIYKYTCTHLSSWPPGPVVVHLPPSPKPVCALNHSNWTQNVSREMYARRNSKPQGLKAIQSPRNSKPQGLEGIQSPM